MQTHQTTYGFQSLEVVLALNVNNESHRVPQLSEVETSLLALTSMISTLVILIDMLNISARRSSNIVFPLFYLCLTKLSTQKQDVNKNRYDIIS